MTKLPRLQHRIPTGRVTEAVTPIPVLARITWHDRHQTVEDGTARAWTSSLVLVQWTTAWGVTVSVWVDATDVRRREEPGRSGSSRV